MVLLDTEEGETIEVAWECLVGIANARLNLDKEQAGKGFDQIRAEARSMWEDDLSRILVEGGTAEDSILYCYVSLA